MEKRNSSTLPEDDSSKKELDKCIEGGARANWDLIVLIDPRLLRLLKGLDTTRSIWERLKSDFASTGLESKRRHCWKGKRIYNAEGDDLCMNLMEFFDAGSQLKCIGVDIFDVRWNPTIIYQNLKSWGRRLSNNLTLRILVRRNAYQNMSKFGRNNFHKKNHSITEEDDNKLKYKCYKCHQAERKR